MYENSGNWRQQIAEQALLDRLIRAVIGPDANWKKNGKICTLIIPRSQHIAPQELQALLHEWGIFNPLVGREWMGGGGTYAIVKEPLFGIIQAQRDLMNLRLSGTGR